MFAKGLDRIENKAGRVIYVFAALGILTVGLIPLYILFFLISPFEMLWELIKGKKLS